MEEPEPLVNSHGVRITFGQFKNKHFTRLPFWYLKWLIMSEVGKYVTLKDGTEMAAYIVAGSEIVRRGERIKNVEVSFHAVDRLSQKYLKTWKSNRDKDEGLCSWAERVTYEAYKWSAENQDKCNNQEEGVIVVPYLDIEWVIQTDLLIPLLKTVKKKDPKSGRIPSKKKVKFMRGKKRIKSNKPKQDTPLKKALDHLVPDKYRKDRNKKAGEGE